MSAYQDPNECYEQIGHLLADAIPEPWKDLRVEVELDEESVQMIGDYAPSHAPDERREIDYVPGLGRCFYDLARLVSTEEKGLYKKCVYTLTDEGRYNVTFEY